MSDDRRALPGYVQPIPNATLDAIGRALYGDDYVSPLARALGVNRATVQRWKDGATRVTPRLAGELQALIKRRAEELATLRRQLAPFVSSGQ